MINRYLLIFGLFPQLSLAECLAVCGNDVSIDATAFPHAALLSGTDQGIIDVFKRLGGSVKLAKIMHEYVSDDELLTTLDTALRSMPLMASRLAFGLSYYGEGKRSPQWIKKLGLAIKKQLRQKGIANRVVIPQEGLALSSVVVQKNYLIDRGSELIIFNKDSAWMIARTVATQEFSEWSQEDIGRPRRNAKRGMLPPKLARMMVNLAAARHLTTDQQHLTTERQQSNANTPMSDVNCQMSDVLLDPFCGSGTVLAQALELGYNVIGSDVSELAVEDTRANLEWLVKERLAVSVERLGNDYTLNAKPYTLMTSDIRHLAEKFPAHSIDAIVTEPDLGPPQQKMLHNEKSIAAVKSQLSKLYHDSFAVLVRLVKPGGRVVMSLPVWRIQGERLLYAIDDLKIVNQFGFSLVDPIPKKLQATSYKLNNDRQSLLYGRSDQFVWREIVILELSANTANA